MRQFILLFITINWGLSVNAQNEIKIDTTKSVVKWTGANLFKFNKHYGTVKFKRGEFMLNNNSIIGGQFEIDMNSIINTDGKYNKMLVWHLKNKDFFNVNKYPTSKLKILSIKYKDANQINIEANLTIKGVTQKINYRSTIKISGNNVIMKSSFIIDRTRWGINYESKSILNSLKDDTISDAIEFDVVISN